jgi:hypothetical protein
MKQLIQQVEYPSDLVDHNQEVREEPVPQNNMKKLLIAYMLVLWEHLPPFKRLPP